MAKHYSTLPSPTFRDFVKSYHQPHTSRGYQRTIEIHKLSWNITSKIYLQKTNWSNSTMPHFTVKELSHPTSHWLNNHPSVQVSPLCYFTTIKLTTTTQRTIFGFDLLNWTTSMRLTWLKQQNCTLTSVTIYSNNHASSKKSPSHLRGLTVTRYKASPFPEERISSPSITEQTNPRNLLHIISASHTAIQRTTTPI